MRDTAAAADAECDGDPERIRLGENLWWAPYHCWTGGIDQIDARLVTSRGDELPGGLDLWAAEVLRAECNPGTVAAAANCERDWAAGAVTVLTPQSCNLGAVSLVVPGAALTRDLVVEALGRFRP